MKDKELETKLVNHLQALEELIDEITQQSLRLRLSSYRALMYHHVKVGTGELK